MTLDKSTSCHISAWALDLLPFPLCFIISLRFGLHIHVHVDAEKWQLKMGRPWIVHHMNDIRYVWDGHSGSGAHIQLIKWWNTQNAYIHLVSTWCLSHNEWSQGFPISCHFLIVITEKNNLNKRTKKKQGDWETRLHLAQLAVQVFWEGAFRQFVTHALTLAMLLFCMCRNTTSLVPCQKYPNLQLVVYAWHGHGQVGTCQDFCVCALH